MAVLLVALPLAPWVGKALVTWVQGRADVARIEAKGRVWTDLANLKPDQAERLHGHLERVRPPPAEAIEPPSDSLGDLAQLHVERQPGDHRETGAARG